MIYSLIIQNKDNVSLLALSHTCTFLNIEIKPLIKKKYEIYYSIGKGGYDELLNYYCQTGGLLDVVYMGAIEGAQKTILKQYIEPRYKFNPQVMILYHVGVKKHFDMTALMVGRSLAYCQDIEFISDFTQNLRPIYVLELSLPLIEEDSISLVKFLEMIDKTKKPQDSLLYRTFFTKENIYRYIHKRGANKIHKFLCGARMKRDYLSHLKINHEWISSNKTSTYGEMLERSSNYFSKTDTPKNFLKLALMYGNVEALKYHILKDGFDISADIIVQGINNFPLTSDYDNYILPLFYSKIPDLHIKYMHWFVNINHLTRILNYALNNGYYKKIDTDIIKKIIESRYINIDIKCKQFFNKWCTLNS